MSLWEAMTDEERKALALSDQVATFVIHQASLGIMTKLLGVQDTPGQDPVVRQAASDRVMELRDIHKILTGLLNPVGHYPERATGERVREILSLDAVRFLAQAVAEKTDKVLAPLRKKQAILETAKKIGD